MILLDQLEMLDAVTDLDQLQSQLLRCRILALLDVKKAQKLMDQIVTNSQVLNQPLIQLDAYLVMAEAWLELGMLETSKELIDQGIAILATIKNYAPSAINSRKAMILVLEGGLFSFKGELQRAEEVIQQSLALREQLQHPQAIAQSLTYLGRAYTYQGEYNRALDVLQRSLTLLEQLQHPHELAQTLFHLGRTYNNKGDIWEHGLDCHQKSLALWESLKFYHGMASSRTWLSFIYIQKGEWDRALELYQESLANCDQLGIPGTFAEAKTLQYLGYAYRLKGEIGLALKHLQQSLALDEARGFKSEIGLTLFMLGEAYLEKGDFEIALDYTLKSLKVFKEFGNETYIVVCLVNLVLLSLELGQREAAQHYLHDLATLQPTLDKKGGTHIVGGIELAQALLLKMSPRTRDKIQAQLLFQQIIEKEAVWFDFVVRASFHLCELLFFEFKTSNDPEILHEFHAVTNRLLKLGTGQHAYSVLAKTYLLQAKLALLELNLPRARHLFTQAQAIADAKGLEKLAQTISHEHDVLLAQLPQWKALQTHKTSLGETRELSDVEDLLSRLARQRAVEPPELHPEAPVLLLILTGSGLTLFSHSFEEIPQLDEHLISGFLSALAAFGQDALATSGPIDRIMYEDYTLAVKPLGPFLVCYIFQGPSYLALQKLDQFLTRIQATPDLHHALTTAMPANPPSKALGSLDLGNEVRLQHLTTEIFTSKHHIHDTGGLP